MEMQNQDDRDKAMTMGGFTSIPGQLNQDSSSAKPAAAETRRNDQTLDHHHHHLRHQQHERGPNPDPDPANSLRIGSSSNSKKPPPPPPSTSAVANSHGSVQYRECLKNHAAAMGGNVVDGCGEFMPGGEDGTPEALKCAACDCHRNFHRREVEGGASSYYPNKNRTATGHQHPQVPAQHQRSPRPPPVMMAFGGGCGAPAESSSEDLNMFHSQPAFSASKKRFRTKFSQEQKDKMQEFAERLGWKIQKQDENEVEQFCAQVGVKRQVFKVWMHNSKQAMKKKQQ